MQFDPDAPLLDGQFRLLAMRTPTMPTNTDWKRINSPLRRALCLAQCHPYATQTVPWIRFRPDNCKMAEWLRIMRWAVKQAESRPGRHVASNG